MTWNFFKTNWFSFALVLLVLIAILRGSGKFLLQNYMSAEKSRERAMVSESRSPTHFSLGAEPGNRPAQPLEVDQATATAFLKRFAPVAVSERKKFGVPASILVAAAFLNSNVGLSDAATEANNYFAIPCTKDWEGGSASLDNLCVRKYETAWASWRDFSIFLATQDWYGGLRQSAGNDWQKWAKGMNGKNISPVSNFGKKLAEVIVYYHLEDLDKS